MANLVDKFIERHIAAGMKDPRKSSVPRLDVFLFETGVSLGDSRAFNLTHHNNGWE